MQKTTPLLIKYIGSTSKQSIPAAFQAATNKASDEIEKKAGNQPPSFRTANILTLNDSTQKCKMQRFSQRQNYVRLMEAGYISDYY